MESQVGDTPDPREGRTVEQALHTAIRFYRPQGTK